MARKRTTFGSRRDDARSSLVCVVLIASLWRAPVPWIHSHTSAPPEAASDSSMTRHLRLFHARHDHDENFGWHVHLTFPWDVLDDPCHRRTSHSPEPTCVYQMPFVASPPAAGPFAGSIDSSSLHFALLETGTDHRLHETSSLVSGLHFLATFSPRVPLRALLCVARC